jgi:hypothetical protein
MKKKWGKTGGAVVVRSAIFQYGISITTTKANFNDIKKQNARCSLTPTVVLVAFYIKVVPKLIHERVCPCGRDNHGHAGLSRPQGQTRS